MASVEEFLAVSFGFGFGYGDGYGSGFGFGFGSGSGSGFGYGSGVTRINDRPVHDIDGVATVITSVKGNLAKGFTLGADLQLTKCYVAKVGDCFAHGSTPEEAFRDAANKQFEDMDEDDRIAAFWAEFDRTSQYPASLFFEWHGKLTGSCEHGRRQFVSDRGIDLESTMTVAGFVETVKGSYGWETVQKLTVTATQESDGA